MKEILEEKLDKIVSKEPSKFWAESDERFKNKETLKEFEEAALKYNEQFVGGQESRYAAEDFINGAKWQQERSYSEEEVKDIIAKTWIKCVGNDGNNFKKIRDEILKQFKL